MKRFILFLAVLVFVLLGSAAIYLALLEQKPENLLIAPGNVEGSAVVVDGKHYTLNYQQQTELLKILNDGKRTKPVASRYSGKIQNLLVYPFNQKRPLQLTQLDASIFKVEDDGKIDYIEIYQPDEMQNILELTYDT